MKKTNTKFVFLIVVFIIYIISNFSLAQTYKPELVVQMGHSSSVASVCFSPDGKYALSGSADNTLKLWDISTGKEIKTFIGHNESVSSVCFSSNSRYALSGSWDRTLRLWDISTGKEIRTFKGHGDSVNSVCISPDGNYALSGSWDKTLKLWDINTGEEIRTFIGHRNCVTSVSFSPDGNYSLSGSLDKTLKLWEISTGKEIRTFEGHSEGLLSVGFSADGKYAVSGSGDSNIKVWDINTGKELRTFPGQNDMINFVSISTDGKYVISGSSKEFKYWDLNTGEEIKTYSFFGESIFSLSLSPDYKYALTGGSDKRIKLWDVTTGKKIKTFPGYGKHVMDVSFSPDGKYALSGSTDKTVKLWDIITGKKVRVFEGHSDYVYSVCFSPDGKYALSGSLDKTLKLWDINTGREIRTFNGHEWSVNSVSFYPDGKFILSGSAKELKLWDISTGKVIRTLEFESDDNSVSFSPDGKYAMSGDFNYTLKLWEINTGERIRTFDICCFVLSVCFSPDGKYVLSGDFGNNLKLWDISTGKEVRTFTGHNWGVTSICFSPDGKRALSGSNDKTIKLWDISTGKEIRTFIGHSNFITSVSISPDDKFALSGSVDMTMKIWDIERGEEVLSLISYGEKDFISITPDNYYTCSRGGLDGVAFVIDNHAFPPEQFDLQYNRPDIILERIGYADSSLINAYREAYKKRLKKMNFREEMFKQDFYLPELKIVDKDNLNGKEFADRNISINIEAYDSLNTLDRINIFVNGVPVYGINGISLRDEKIHEYSGTIEIELSDSINKIEASVLDSAGVESLKDNIEVTYIGKKDEPKTYFIGIGVSDYQNKRKKLNYAAKDIRDIAELYKDKAIIDTLIDEQATRENILRLKEKLLNTKVNDEIIIALSGHGILSDSNDFYYATWDMDFTNPEKNGLLFDDLDKLLDSIPARKKVLLIDACNSGEVDRDKNQNADMTKKNEEIAKKDDVKGGDPIDLGEVQSESKLGLQNSFDLMQEIFVNLTRGNGAVVISAARGYQSALEKESYGSGNGAFTACIIELINSKKGEHITVGELKEYVIKRVEEITNGLQKPTSRRENLAYDFVVW